SRAATVRPVDRAALERWLRRLAPRTDAPWLHGEVARRMAERLALVKLRPEVVIDWWSRAGASAAILRRAYPKARVLAVEPDALRTAPAAPAPWWSARRWRAAAPALDAAALPEGGAQLVWANMMLHAVADPAAQMAAWRRALVVDGFLMFSTLGPDTLKTLREIYRDAGWGPPHAPFVDMHDLGDMLVGAGFAEPVMDQAQLTLTWATPAALLDELRLLGSNADPARAAGLRTPRWRARLEAALAARADREGRIALEFELVFGHAFNPRPRLRVQGETRVGVDELQRMARAGRRGRDDEGLG
ncbi:MAG TPA: methyltransferase domain-containing protein, partial [Burkholderiaceae bacterium]|nr:methyltransferase domain-containing protein [Burkholderiaceae bacterium]